MLYLSSRAIGMIDDTKKYISDIKQEGYKMPLGPVLVSPDRMAKSLHREVIIKQPHLFKIACLTAVLNLFPQDTCPFYAGFGNRDTDSISYRAVSIDVPKIFIINKKGSIKQFNNMEARTYQ